ncbi:unnamed protein product [Brugia pahangi]|uniref:G_PROTEIN_RECEP_F1_2 domain-containing protein n=1 Tax=Brugia pahangi TaxID=6280 RepID=A0A0N4TSJ5_BRUPA|nr:unnamed protein product [Brugia pahangi]
MISHFPARYIRQILLQMYKWRKAQRKTILLLIYKYDRCINAREGHMKERKKREREGDRIMFISLDSINIWITITTPTVTAAVAATTKAALISKTIKFNSNTENDNEELVRKFIRLIFSISYFLLFLFGTIGNGSVIVMIVNVLTATRRKGLNSVRVNPSNTLHVVE